MTLGRALLLALALLLVSAPALASPARLSNFPCKGCLFEPPPVGATKAPLLVVLHGDTPPGKAPLVERDATPWFAAAIERGVAVLAPMCPKSEGCRVGSYWQWSDGDPPAWIEAQIDLVAKVYPIDPDRVWIAGWSGGASFLGYHYARLAGRYAAVVFAGGGMPKSAPSCPLCAPPAYFLVGDRNPLHHLAKGLRADVEGCTSDVTWDLLPGKDHAGEWRALGAPGKTAQLLDWLSKHPRTCGRAEAAAAAEAGAEAEAGAAAEAEAEAAAGAEAEAEAGAAADAAADADPIPAIVPPRSHCGCRLAGVSHPDPSPALLAFFALLPLSRRFNRKTASMNRTEMAPRTASR